MDSECFEPITFCLPYIFAWIKWDPTPPPAHAALSFLKDTWKYMCVLISFFKGMISSTKLVFPKLI